MKMLNGLIAAFLLGLMTACGGGGGGGSSDTGTLKLSLTDSPACGFDKVFVTVEKVRVHRSASAEESDAGWSEVVLASPTRVDLLSLNNGTLLPLGQTELPAGTYTQMRLVLSPNSAANPLANAIQPTGGTVVALTTPSAQTSGLKANINIVIPAGQVADFAIDFDACKSFVKAGNSGQYLIKPVLSVIPILSSAGQRIVGYLDASMLGASTQVSVQQSGVPQRTTSPEASGRFVLYPVPVGTYDLVITASGHANAALTGVPASSTVSTVIGSDSARILTPLSATSHTALGSVSLNGSVAATDGAVMATQAFASGTRIEVGFASADALSGSYSLSLPTAPPAYLAYSAGATSFVFNDEAANAGLYRLEANVPSLAAKTADVDLGSGNVTTDFVFP